MTKLQDKRKEEGLTQLQIATKANITVKGYQNYESGKRLPRVDTAKLIARALNSTVDKLF